MTPNRPEAGKNMNEADWITKLRQELMLSKMTHSFTFSRDEVIELLSASKAATIDQGYVAALIKRMQDYCDSLAPPMARGLMAEAVRVLLASSPAAPSPAQTDEQGTFEAWLKQPHPHNWNDCNHPLTVGERQAAHMGWFARAALQAAPAAEQDAPAQSDNAEEDAYVINRLSTVLAEVAAALMGDDADGSAADVLAKLPEAAQTLKIEVELYRANATAAPAQSGEPVAYVSPNGATRIVLINGATLNDDDELYAAPQPSPTAVVLDDERAAFEAWYRKEIHDATMYRRDVKGSDRFGEYCQWFHEEAWKAWQARAASPQPVGQDFLTEDQRETIERAIEVCNSVQMFATSKGLREILTVAQPVEQTRALTDDPIALLIAKHAEELENNEYAYFELAYTRRTEWMAWICSNHRDDDLNRKVIARGQGSTPQEACENAMTAARGETE